MSNPFKTLSTGHRAMYRQDALITAALDIGSAFTVAAGLMTGSLEAAGTGLSVIALDIAISYMKGEQIEARRVWNEKKTSLKQRDPS